MKFNFKGQDLKIQKVKLSYHNNIGLVIREGNGSGYANLTINANIELPGGTTLLKNYSECETIANELIKQKIVIPTGEFVSSGFVTCPICKLCDELIFEDFC